MPIYAYRCASCGHAKDVLQKVSDPVLTTCPACNADAFQKQVTAAGFQLKGSGWYVTDFRGSNSQSGAKAEPSGGEVKTEGGKAPTGTADSGKGEAAKGDSASTPDTGAKSAGGEASSGGCGGSCACH